MAGPSGQAGRPTLEGWARSASPLRVALIGWARLSSQAWEGSGYNLNASELARGLVLSGHEVFYLQSGMNYRLWGGPRVRELETWGGVRCFDLVNAPIPSPAAHNFPEAPGEAREAVGTALVVRWVREVGARVVHVHSIEGYGLDLIGAIRDIGVPVVVTPHNYHYVCPQVDLLHEETRVCEDYDGGRRCVGCLKMPPPRKTKMRRATGQTLERVLGPYRADVVRKALYGVKPAVRGLLRGEVWRPWSPPKLMADRLGDPELGRGFREGAGVTDATGDGLIRHAFEPAEDMRPRAFGTAPADQNERMLASDRHLVVLNNYGERRRAGVAALNRASLVTPPSDFLRRLHVTMGVEEARTRWVRLGQPHFDQINRRSRRSPFYGRSPWDVSGGREPERPLRLAFYGTTRANKGLEVLAQAIPLIDREARRRCHFIVRAHGNEWGYRKRLSLYPEVSVYSSYDLYQLIPGGGEYDVGILPHIWLENSPLVMLEHLHAGKFVIASRLGGPVDWITPPRNGLLFAAGRADELAECVRRLAMGEVRVPSAKEVHGATELRSYPDHVAEVEGIYREVIARESGGAGAGDAASDAAGGGAGGMLVGSGAGRPG